ncbi:hypothetical protein [Chondromyces apiculatus]|uniref:JmjC domain-containing protein n=1 Tax=Chondromyces apiculatus DSM 436 TaxID=1192034 RepID=A0A017T7N6_9BACT|nr:hypothetical protein [Chondromyces apiculatus]EYF04571.1 Hypothetical protein CAP_4391 [Chondromyces apiculatus DSM 436]
MSDLLGLHRLVSPIPLDRFKRDCWGRKAAVARGPVGRFGALSDLPEVWSAEALVLAQRGPITVGYPRPWLRGVRPAVAPTADYPAGEGLVLHHLGASLYVRHVERLDPRLNRALSSLRGTVGSTTQVRCDVLLTGGALPADPSLPGGPIFLVHLRGEQRWKVDGEVLGATPRAARPGPAPRTAARSMQDRQAPRRAPGTRRGTEVSTRPGTVLYLPGGAARLTASTEGAMTLVLSVPPLSAIEPVLARATEMLLRVEALRAPALVPPTTSGKRKSLASAGEALKSLPGALRGLDPRRLLAASRGRRFLRTPGVRASLRHLPGQAGTSVLSVRSRREPPTEVTLDATFAEACAWILEQRPGFWEQDARLALGLDGESLTGLLDALQQAGLLHERSA